MRKGRAEPVGTKRSKKMKLVKLKPCPFCGGPAKIIQLAHYNLDHGEPATIGCERCAIYLSRSFVPEDLFHGMPTREEYKATDKEAIDAWNRRAMLDTVPCAGAVEARHGHWTDNGGLLMCSCCGAQVYKRFSVGFKYCPYCGAEVNANA